MTTTKTFDYTDFANVEVGSAFQVDVVQSNEWGVSITAEDGLFDHINVKKVGDAIKIGLDWSSWTHFPWATSAPKAHIAMPELHALKVSGASKGTVTGFRSDHDTDISVSGASALDVDVEVGNAAVEVSGASRLTGHLNAHNANLELKGASRAELSGSGSNVEVKASGASRADMGKLQAEDAWVDLSGASRASISANGKMSVAVSGASSLEYMGNPVLTKSEVSGASRIHRKK